MELKKKVDQLLQELKLGKFDKVISDGEKLLKKSTVEWIRKYPKDVDLKWKEMIGKGKYELTNKKPEFNLDVIEHNMKNANYKKTIEHNFWR